jgi:hypothetical protein
MSRCDARMNELLDEARYLRDRGDLDPLRLEAILTIWRAAKRRILLLLDEGAT